MPGQNDSTIITNWNTSRTTFAIHSIHAVNHLTNSTALESKIFMCYHLVQVSLVKMTWSLTIHQLRQTKTPSASPGGQEFRSVSIRTAAAGVPHFLIKVLLFHPLDKNADNCQGCGIPQHPPVKCTSEGLFLCSHHTEPQRHCDGSSDLPNFSSYLQQVTHG